MTSIYKDKVIKAVSLAKDFNQVDYIQEKIKNTEQINRRTKEGRELTEELLALTYQRKTQLADAGEAPF